MHQLRTFVARWPGGAGFHASSVRPFCCAYATLFSLTRQQEPRQPTGICASRQVVLRARLIEYFKNAYYMIAERVPGAFALLHRREAWMMARNSATNLRLARSSPHDHPTGRQTWKDRCHLMKICVCVKHIPDPNLPMTVDPRPGDSIRDKVSRFSIRRMSTASKRRCDYRRAWR